MTIWNVAALVAIVFPSHLRVCSQFNTTSLLYCGRWSFLTALYKDTFTDPWCLSARFICLFHPRLTFKESLWEGARKEVDLF